jgi:hypothetical protein
MRTAHTRLAQQFLNIAALANPQRPRHIVTEPGAGHRANNEPD